MRPIVCFGFWGSWLLVACGRTSLGVEEATSQTQGGSAADPYGDSHTDGQRDTEHDEDSWDTNDTGVFLTPPDFPPEDETCGNGKIDPGELCYLVSAYPSRIDPCAIAVADLDLDGHLDVVVPNSDFFHEEQPPNVASVLRGTGTGLLGAPEAWLAGGDFVVGVTVGDFDNDGLPDLAVVNSAVSTMNVLRAYAPAAYLEAAPTTVGLDPVMTAAGDVDKDGDLDLVVTNSADYTVMVLHNQGGTFELAESHTLPGNPWEVILGDLSGDGVLDMAAALYDASTVFVWQGRGDGTFAPAGSLPTGSGTQGLAALDLDGDAHLDLVASNTWDATVTVYMHDGLGTYVAHSNVAVGIGPRSLVGADYDMDGRMDVATADESDNAVLIMVGDGTGNLVPSVSYPVGQLPSAVRSGDFNEDGVPDLVTSNQSSNTVGMLLSNP